MVWESILKVIREIMMISGHLNLETLAVEIGEEEGKNVGKRKK